LQETKEERNLKQRRSYEHELKGEILKMLVSGRKTQGSFSHVWNCCERTVSLKNHSDYEYKDDFEDNKGLQKQFGAGF